MALILDTIFRTDKAQKDLRTFTSKASGDVKRLERESSSSATRIGSAFSGIGKTLGAIGFATAAVQVAAFARETINLASAMQEAQNRFDTVFAGVEGATAAITKQAQAVGRGRKEWIEFTGSLGDVLKPLGFTAQEAFALSTSITKAAVDVASFTNKLDSQAVNAFQSALVGEREALKSLGIVISEADVKTEAYASGIAKTGEELTKTQKALATYNLLLKNSVDAHGDAIKTQGSYANQVKRVAANWEEVKIAAGEALIPTATTGLQEVNNLLDGVIRNLDFFKKGWELGGQVISTVTAGWRLSAKSIIAIMDSLRGTSEETFREVNIGWQKSESTLGSYVDRLEDSKAKTEETLDSIIAKAKERSLAEAEAEAKVRAAVKAREEEQKKAEQEAIRRAEEKKRQLEEMLNRDIARVEVAARRYQIESDLEKLGLSESVRAAQRLEIEMRRYDVLQQMGASQEVLTAQMRTIGAETQNVRFGMELITIPQEEIVRMNEQIKEGLVTWNPELEKTKALSFEIGDAMFSRVGAALDSAIDKAIRMKGLFGDILKDIAKILFRLGVNALTKALGIPFLPFATGGVVPGFAGGGLVRDGLPASGADNRIIKAQVGEGILTRQAVQSIGGERGVKAINEGHLPSVTFGNIVINTQRVDERFVTNDLLPMLERLARSGRFNVTANRLVQKR